MFIEFHLIRENKELIRTTVERLEGFGFKTVNDRAKAYILTRA
jgi:hypothetical protein